MCMGLRDGQGSALFDPQLRDVFERAGDHRTRIGKVEALAHHARKIEHTGNNHAFVSPRQIERDMISEHDFSIARECRQKQGRLFNQPAAVWLR